MEVELTKARELRDQELNEALDTGSTEELDGLSIQDQRLARILEYEEAALDRPDPLAAVIGMGNASLQRIFEHLGVAVLAELDDRPHTLEECRELEPEIRLMVKMRSAIETDLKLGASVDRLEAVAFSTSKKIDAQSTTFKRNLVPKHWTGQS